MYDDARRILTQRMSDMWVDTPVAWPNGSPISGVDSWVRFAVVPGLLEKTSIGSDVQHYRLSGYVAVQVFVPAGSGDGEAGRMAWEVGEVFRGYGSGGVRCSDPEFRPVGVSDGWYQINVTVPFVAQGTI